MTKSLVIVESPAKAKTIARFLDGAAQVGSAGDFVLEASVGHVRDLPQKKEELPEELRGSHGRLMGIDPENHFDAYYVVSPAKKKVVAELRRALKGVDQVILATDEDREGEAIAWHVVEVLKPKVPVRRMVFHEITPQAISDALASPRELDMKLVEAQEARRILDRIVGWETSPVLWRRVTGARSAGRVQSVAVRLVVERERARMAFRSGAWFDLEAALTAHEIGFGASLAELDGRRVAESRDFDPATGGVAADREVVVLDQAAATALAERLAGATFSVGSVESKRVTERPYAPFTTSTLQQESGRKLRFGSARTMAVAQRLYERGYITYMRTDSTSLSGQAVDAARRAISERFGAEYLPDQARKYTTKVKNAQEAHEAIRPAGEHIRTPGEVAGELDGDERRLYELVWIRTIASQMADAKVLRTTLRIGATSDAGEKAVFRASGKVYEFLGFRRAYVEDVDDGESQDKEARLPGVEEGEQVRCDSLEAVGHETQPPSRFSEAALVKELERLGIGRPSTYASVIETIQARDYAWKKGTALVPTWTAFAVTQLLERHFAHLVDFGFTATMEEALDVIARGEGEAEKWLHSFYFGNGQAGLRELCSEENLASIDAREVNTVPIGVDDDGHEVVVRVGRYGPFVQRAEEETASLPPDLPPDELTVARALDLIARQAEGPRSLGTDPEAGLPVYVLTGRFGPYVQLGEQDPESKEKPRRASLFKSMTVDTVSLEDAMGLLSLPRIVGVDADGQEITAQNGRYGPYLKRGTDSRSLDSEELLLTVTLEEALTILAQPKRGRGRVAKPPLAELGEHPESGAAVRVLEGRYGPYVTDGTTNATVPRGRTPEELTLDEAVALLRARLEAGPSRAKKPAKKTAKKAAKKPAKKAAKKPAKKAAKKPVKKAAEIAAKKAVKMAAGAGSQSGVVGPAESDAAGGGPDDGL
ncbi:MAG: type I DNA topoisomerase [Acidimicrobiia bacterium]|nr:type I DNA topoisomerase [Acidimicrobiia bacterium]